MEYVINIVRGLIETLGGGKPPHMDDAVTKLDATVQQELDGVDHFIQAPQDLNNGHLVASINVIKTR
jgi:hypothetical protein